MKKILVVLLILAVAGGVFAQEGTWSLNGSVEIGTRLNLDPDPEVDGEDDPATATGIGWHNWDAIRGFLGIGYTRGNVYVGLGINTIFETRLTTTFNGDTFRGKFQWDGFEGIFGGDGAKGYLDGAAHSMAPDVKRLWGEYKFFDGAITLLAAYRNDESEYWFSDQTATFDWDGQGNKGSYLNGWFYKNPMADGHTFTFNDAWMGIINNHLIVDAAFGGLNFGVMLPGLFQFGGYWQGSWAYKPSNQKIVDDVIKKAILGVKFGQSPFEFAAQFQLENYGVYFGGKFFTGPITVGLSFMGVLDGDGGEYDSDPTEIKIGGRVEYAGSGFGGGIKAFYDSRNEAMGAATPFDSEWDLVTIGVEPFFFYDAIPSHLRFALDMGFYFMNDTNGSDSTKVTVWAFEPQIFWNFLGTGAGSYWSYDTGIMIRYRMANADTRDLPNFGGTTNNSVNFLDVVFKWGF